MKNTCYLSYLSYLTFDTTSYQSQKPNDKRVRMSQPVLSSCSSTALDFSMSKQ